MSGILFAFIILSVLGILLGLGLSFADKKLSVEKDEKLVELESFMPGANCGGCGFAGCSDYAQAVFSGTAKPGLCSPGGQVLADRMSDIMGLTKESVARNVAFVFCNASCEDTIKNFVYKGIKDCNAAGILFNGDVACKSGCLHLLSCKKVCNSDAIFVSDSGAIVVDKNKCIGCGRCVDVCPRHVIKLVPYDVNFLVACNNIEKGVETRKKCNKGCIGCKICETKFPDSGFIVNDNLASVDFQVHDLNQQNSAMETCPRKVIVKH